MITVNDLVLARSGELAMAAGHGGGDRIITWAHVCDLPDPWAWVQPGDLLMTTGDGLPAEDDAQREWLSKLIDVGISGIVLAPRPGAPAASAAMTAVADERSVPLLAADFSLEFVGLSRTVIESAVRSERDHITTARRLFDVYSEALRSRSDLAGRLDVVARSIGWSITVTRSADGTVLAQGGRTGGAGAPITVPVPGRVPVDVVVQPQQRRLLDGALVQYLAGLVGIELEHLARDVRERRRRGEAALDAALDGRIGAAQLRHELAGRGMDDGLLVLACFRTTTAHDPDEPTLDQANDVDPIVSRRGPDELLVLVPAGWPGFDEFRHRLAPSAHVGLSAAFAPGADLVDAHLQARIAAGRARESGRPTLDYTDLDDPGSTGPRSAAEMRRLVARTLGPLFEHDHASRTDLVRTLETFQDHDRSWTTTASALGVHRQTLMYRIRQVELLTGIRPTSTEGIARLWTALDAARTLGLVSPPEHAPSD